MKLVEFKLGTKVYKLTPTQAAVVHRLRDAEQTERANALIRKQAVEVVTIAGEVERQEEPQVGGAVAQGAVSTLDLGSILKS